MLRWIRDGKRHRSRPVALGRGAAGDGGRRIRPAAPRRGFRATPHQTPGAAVRAKSTPTDPVTVVDTETERLLRDRLAELRPGEHILGEEEGGSTAGRDGLTWVLDPIDGTVNFVYGIEAYAVSVGVQRDGRVIGRSRGQRARWGAVLRGAGSRRSACSRTASRPRWGPVRPSSCRCRWWAPGSPMRPSNGHGRPRSSPGCFPSCATCDGWARARSICAWWPPDGSTPTTRTAYTSGTGRPAR